MKAQARITLPPETRRDIDRLRSRWNPEKALGNPAHVTVVYQDEAPDVALLTERLRRAAERTPPFRLVFGAAARFADPIRGAFLTVADPANRVAAVREQVLAPPFTRRVRFGLHVTLLHPDQGQRLEEAWPAFERLPSVGAFIVTNLQLVGPDNELLMAVPLLGTEADSGAGLPDPLATPR